MKINTNTFQQKEGSSVEPFPSYTFGRLFFWRYVTARDMHDSVFEELLDILRERFFVPADVPSLDEIMKFFENGEVPFFPPVKIFSKGGVFYGILPEAYVAMQMAIPEVSKDIVNSMASEDATMHSVFDGNKMKVSNFFATKSAINLEKQIFLLGGFAQYSPSIYLKITKFFQKKQNQEEKTYARGDVLMVEMAENQNKLRVIEQQMEYELNQLKPVQLSENNIFCQKRLPDGNLANLDVAKYIHNPIFDQQSVFRTSMPLPYLTVLFCHFSDGWSYKNTPQESFF